MYFHHVLVYIFAPLSPGVLPWPPPVSKAITGSTVSEHVDPAARLCAFSTNFPH